MKKILVGVSGGIDSLATVLYFKEKGYDVYALYLILTEKNIVNRKRVEEIYKSLKVPLLIFDGRKIFKERIIDYFLNTYREGKTPNPCAMCNRLIKFPILNEISSKNSFEYFSTGHYIHIKDSLIFKPFDNKKDQTYYVSTVEKKFLKKFVNPITSFSTKEDIKNFVFERVKFDFLKNYKESQDICFVQKDYVSFLKENGFEEEEGNMLTTKGDILKKHKGFYHFTIGKRAMVGGSKERLFIKKIIPSSNSVIVSSKKELGEKIFYLSPVEVFTDDKVDLRVKVRYRSDEVECDMERSGDGRISVKTKKPIYGITPGQIGVIYKNDMVVLSGIIEKEEV